MTQSLVELERLLPGEGLAAASRLQAQQNVSYYCLDLQSWQLSCLDQGILPCKVGMTPFSGHALLFSHTCVMLGNP